MEENTIEAMQNMDIIQRLNTCLDQLTKSKRAVADYILENTMEAAFSTVDKTAHAIGVSTTTVVRLAISLGYSGYAELQAALKEYVTTTAASVPAGGMLQVDTDQDGYGENGSILEQEIRNLRETRAMLSQEEIDRAVDALSAAPRIYVVGERNYEGVARFLAYNMDRMFLNTQYTPSDFNHMPERINHIGPGDVLVYFCFGRYLRQIGDLVQGAKRRGAKVIGITDSVSSPWAVYTDHIFTCANRSLNFYHSPQGALFVANVLLSRCADRNPERVEESLKQIDQAARTLPMFMKK